MTPQSLAVFSILCSGILFPREADSRQVPPTEEVFRSFSDRVVKIEVQETGSAAKASIGSGFFVSPMGHLVTNYHVVAAVVQHPDRYRASLAIGDSEETTALEVLNVDVAHDLAIVKSETAPPRHFVLAEVDAPQGLRLYSLGHPLDLGLDIVEGSYNGFLKHALDERIHFTGSLNPGMSGGPAITAEGRVMGVNVATAGEQVSFLVPVKWAVAGASLLLGLAGVLSYTGPEEMVDEIPVRVPLKALGSGLIRMQTTSEFLEDARLLRARVDAEAAEE